MSAQAQAFHTAADLLDATGVTWWLSDGSVLGAIRSGRFLASDRDVDLGVWAGDYPKVRQAFRAAGWRDHPRAIDPCPGIGGYKIDLHPHVTDGERVWYDLGLGKVRYQFDARLFDRLAPVELEGRTCLAPSPADRYLEAHYGPDWRTPKTPWRWDRDPPCIVDPVTLSAVIMAHPRRRKWAEQLAARVGVPIVWDERNQVWDTARRAWLAHDPHATHHLVLQDDALVCDRLLDAARVIAAAVGAVPVSLTVIDYRMGARRGLYYAAVDAGLRWFQSNLGLTGIATILPVADIAAMVEFGDRQVTPHDDLKLARFYRHRNQPIWFTIPSLVQHRPAGTNPTLVAGNGGRLGEPRTASQFVGEDRSVLDLDWSLPLDPTPRRRRTFMDPTAPVSTWRCVDGRVRHVRAGSTREERYANHGDWFQVPTADDGNGDDGGTPAGGLELLGGKGGWWEIATSDGEVLDKVRGRDAAEARRAELVAADG